MTGLRLIREVSFGSQLASVSRDIRSFVAFVRACLSSVRSMDADEAEKAAHSSAGIVSG